MAKQKLNPDQSVWFLADPYLTTDGMPAILTGKIVRYNVCGYSGEPEYEIMDKDGDIWGRTPDELFTSLEAAQTSVLRDLENMSRDADEQYDELKADLHKAKIEKRIWREAINTWKKEMAK